MADPRGGGSSTGATSPYTPLPEEGQGLGRGFLSPSGMDQQPQMQASPQQAVYPVAYPAGVPGYGAATPAYIGQAEQGVPYAPTMYAPPVGTGPVSYPPGTVLIAGNAGGPPVVVAPENMDFCSTSCFCSCFSWFALYVVLIVAASVLTMFVPVLGLLLLALLPAVTILTFLETRFHKSVIRMQMVITFFEAVGWMIPIVIVENIVQYLLIVKTNLPEEGLCGLCVLSSLLQAYLIAGLFEESVKYLAVRRVAFKPYVVDPRALIVYSCCAGAAFGTVEDIMYNLSYGLATAIVRAFISVPLHCGTGLIIGTSLADTRFFENDRERWYKTLVLPILIHGTFDAVSFLLASGKLGVLSFVIDVLILVGTYLLVRKRLLVLLRAFPQEVDAHLKILNGEIEAPACCNCCNPRACPSCYF